MLSHVSDTDFVRTEKCMHYLKVSALFRMTAHVTHFQGQFLKSTYPFNLRASVANNSLWKRHLRIGHMGGIGPKKVKPVCFSNSNLRRLLTASGVPQPPCTCLSSAPIRFMLVSGFHLTNCTYCSEPGIIRNI